LKTISGHTDWIRTICCSDDGKLLASGGNDNTIMLWDTESWEFITELEGHDHVIEVLEFAPVAALPMLKKLVGGNCKQYLFSASRDKIIHIWSTEARAKIYSLVGHASWVRDLCFYPDGRYLVSVGDDKILHVWNLTTGEVFKAESGHSQFIHCCTFHPKLPILATGSLDKTVRLWPCSGMDKNSANALPHATE
jgi:platelet-activating factor acetylhydrolase IB subunit alpha